MRRSIATLLISLMISMTFAGCFTDDPDDSDHDSNGDDPGGNDTNGNNTTLDPWGGSRVPPEPVIQVSLESDGENVNSPFLVRFDSYANLTFDASASVVHQGDIEAVSWRVVNERGLEERSTNMSFTVDLGQMKSDRFGVYEVIVRVQDSAGVLGEATSRFVINYQNSWALPDGFYGPGTENRGEPGESQPSELFPGFIRGTFVWHQATLAPSAVAINATLTFEGIVTTDQMKVFLFDPSVESPGQSADAQPTAASDTGDSPIRLAFEAEDGALQTGAWKLRAELDGVGVESYLMEVVVTYSTELFGTGPAAGPGDEDDDEDGE